MGPPRNKDYHNRLRRAAALLRVVRTAREAGSASSHGPSPHEAAGEVFRLAGPLDLNMHDAVCSLAVVADSTTVREEYSRIGMEDVGCPPVIATGQIRLVDGRRQDLEDKQAFLYLREEVVEEEDMSEVVAGRVADDRDLAAAVDGQKAQCKAKGPDSTPAPVEACLQRAVEEDNCVT